MMFVIVVLYKFLVYFFRRCIMPKHVIITTVFIYIILI
jgi:hypothetical protein